MRIVETVFARTGRITLPNGLAVLLCPDPEADGVAITLGVKAGYFDEPLHLLGISHIVEHLFCWRAKVFLQERYPSRSVAITGATIYNHTTYSTTVPADDVTVALEALSDAYWWQAVDEGHLDRERRVVLHEAGRKADSSRDSMVEQLYGQLFATHQLGRWRVGSAQSIAELSAETVRSFRESYYQPANSVLVLTGSFDGDLVLGLVERSFGARRAYRDRPPPRPAECVDSTPPVRRFRTDRRDILLARFALGWRTPGAGTEEAPLFDIVSALVAQDTHLRTLEERHLGWSVEVRHYIPGDVGVFMARAETYPEASAEAIRTICRAVERVTRRQASATAFSHAKLAVASSWAEAVSRPHSRARSLAEWDMLSGCQRALTDFTQAMASTSSGVHGLAMHWLHADSRAICIHSPQRDTGSHAADVRRKPRPIGRRSGPGAPSRLTKRRLLAVDSPVPGLTRLRTAAGSPVLIVPAATRTKSVSVGLYIRGGRSDESIANSGITNALVGILTRSGLPHRQSRWMKTATEIGFALTPTAGLDYFGWSVAVDPRHVGKAMELLSVLLQESRINEPALDEHQFRAVGSVAAAYESPPRASLAVALRAAYGSHAYGLPDHGVADSIQRLTAAAVSDWRDRLCRSPRIAFAIIGPASPDALRLADINIEAAGGTDGLMPPPQWPEQPTDVHERRRWREAGLSVLFPVGSLSAVASPLHHVIATLVGGQRSRLLNDLRRKAMCYVATGLVRIGSLAGAIGCYAETTTTDLAECRHTILAEFLRLATGQIDESQLEAAKGEVASRWTTGTSSLEARKQHLLLSSFFGDLESYGRYPRELSEVTAESVSQAVSDWGGTSPPVTALVGGGPGSRTD